MERYGVFIVRWVFGKDCGIVGWVVCVYSEIIYDLFKIIVNKV